jgi:ATP-independent RNA helicase DbpA
LSDLDFSNLPLAKDLLSNLGSLGYLAMTPIQAQSLPTILAGKDVIGQAKTGSGKTVAFGLGVLNKLDVKRYNVQSLVICPTRELADQVATEIRKLARAIKNIKVLTVCGGAPFGLQASSLKHGVQIVVGTPGRIQDHLDRETLRLDNIATLVLDEADRMLEMGFEEAIDEIVRQLPATRQTLLFSATYPQQIKGLARRYLVDPQMVKVDATHDATTIAQSFYEVDKPQKRFDALQLLLLHHRPQSTLVFCNTKRETQSVADKLAKRGFSVAALHGDLEQKDRDIALIRFANKSISILVATDVAARGLDIIDLDAVINFDIAQDAEIHLHRIGRTGRAGSKGVAYSLFSEQEKHRVARFDTEVDPIRHKEPLPPDSCLELAVLKPEMATLRIDAGKKQKIRAGDILGALTGEQGVVGTQVGKINVAENWAYIAVNRESVRLAHQKLADGKLKGRSVRVKFVG